MMPYTKAIFGLCFRRLEQTYTPKNIAGAWSGAGLILYNKQKILRRLKGPLSSIPQDIPQEQIQTPRNPRQFRSFMAQTEHLMEEERSEERRVGKECPS